MDGGSVLTGAGTRFYISDAQVEDTLVGFRSIDNWVEVEQVESISEFGVESEDIVRMAIGQDRADHIKGVRSPVGLNVIVGHDPFDDGQDEFNIAEGFAVRFAFQIVIPISDGVNQVIYFQALVRSNKLTVGTASDVVRRNYACTLDSQIITTLDVTTSVSARFQGTGTLDAFLNMRIGVAASFQGAGNLSASLNQRLRVAATFAGAGALSANISIITSWPVAAVFTGAGALSARINIPNKVSAAFQGAGRLVADITTGAVVETAFQPNAFQNDAYQITFVSGTTIEARFAGAGGLAASINLKQKISASFQGAGSLSGNVTIVANFVLLRTGDKLLLRDGISRLKLGH